MSGVFPIRSSMLAVSMSAPYQLQWF